VTRWRALFRLLKGDSLHRVLLAEREAAFRAACTVGADFRIGEGARCLNHSGDPARVRIGDGVLVDGTLECYAHGLLAIGDHAFVGRSRIYCAVSVSIGTGALVSDNVAIMDSDLHPRAAEQRLEAAVAWAGGRFPDVYTGVPNAPVVIGDHAWIGFGACVLKGVTVGEGAVISMGVYLGASTKIVNRDTGEVTTGKVPPYAVVVPGTLPGKDGGPGLYCAVIVKQVDARTRAKTAINELLRT